MNGRRLVLPLAIALFSSITALVACGGSDSDSPLTTNDDAGGSTPTGSSGSTGTKDAGKDSSSTKDAGKDTGKGDTEDDAGDDAGDDEGGTSPGTTSSLFLRGDFVTDNVAQLGVAKMGATPAVTPFAIGKQVNAFAVTPDHTKIVAASDVAVVGRFDLVVANTDGSNVTALVSMPADAKVLDVAVSPDGTHVAYIAEIGGLADAYVVSITGGAPVKVSPDRPGAAAMPANLRTITLSWSRDSKGLALVGDMAVDKRNDVFVADLSTATPSTSVVFASTATPATTVIGANSALRPVWTSGGKVCFKGNKAEQPSDTYQLFCAAKDGTASVMAHFPAAPVQLGSFGISPDGTKLAFSADSAAHVNAYEVFMMPADDSAAPTRVTAGNLTTATRGPSFNIPLGFSPDGTTIAFVGDNITDDRYELFVVPVAGGTEKRVAVLGTDADATRDIQTFAWSPDSKTLAFVGDHRMDNAFELFSVPNVTTADQVPTLIQGVPTSGDVFDLDWRP